MYVAEKFIIDLVTRCSMLQPNFRLFFNYNKRYFPIALLNAKQKKKKRKVGRESQLFLVRNLYERESKKLAIY